MANTDKALVVRIVAVLPDGSPGQPEVWKQVGEVTGSFGTGKGERQSIFITNGGMLGAFLGGTWSGLSLVKIEVGVPGLPMP